MGGCWGFLTPKPHIRLFLLKAFKIVGSVPLNRLLHNNRSSAPSPLTSATMLHSGASSWLLFPQSPLQSREREEKQVRLSSPVMLPKEFTQFHLKNVKNYQTSSRKRIPNPFRIFFHQLNYVLFCLADLGRFRTSFIFGHLVQLANKKKHYYFQSSTWKIILQPRRTSYNWNYILE